MKKKKICFLPMIQIENHIDLSVDQGGDAADFLQADIDDNNKE